MCCLWDCESDAGRSMKVLLELLGDACRVLKGVESLSEFRPESRDRMRELLSQLRLELDRLLDADAPVDPELAGREPFLQRALEAIASQSYGEARGVLAQAVERFPQDFEFLSYLGLIAWEQGDLVEAERSYRRAMEVVFSEGLNTAEVESGDDPVLRAVEGRALCLYRLGELEAAQRHFEWLGINFSEQYIGCLFLAGEAYHRMGLLHEALRCYEAVPVEPAVLYNRGLALYGCDRLEESARALIEGFVANIYVATTLLGRFGYRRPCTPGYLGSETYAEELVEACASLWHGHPGSVRFMERCFDHALVQAHLQQCGEQGGTRLLQAGESGVETDAFLEQLHDAGTLQSMARRVIQRLDA
ncbi:tetratricopeptide repeat protein [Lujinxingia sediminis]|uniref:Tetratricopeptide repeat protein n=2 Tax=Lujinxingia sediminis TaxID=2480984 RepID=A0ABY0CYB2_9DELT|nr:tetratricopeptide repeat protein [Lujinxingia sediminis]